MSVNIFRDRLKLFAGNKAIFDQKNGYDYGDILSFSDDIACFLFENGATQKNVVAIELPRSIEAVLLAITCCLHKIPFFFLGTKLPKHKKEKIMDMACAHLKICKSKKALKKFEIKGISFSLTCFNKANTEIILPLPVVDDHIAYLGISSGSTGEVKCAAIGFRGLLNLMEQQSAYFSLSSKNKILQVANTGFDAIISEIFVTLWSGSELCVADVDDMALIPFIRKSIIERDIDVITMTPSVAQKIDPKVLTKLKTLILVGEVINKKLLKSILNKVRIINAFGPCETTVCSHMSDIKFIDDVNCIGKPIKNFQAKIINDLGEIAKPQESGELYLYGDSVGYGYLGDNDAGNFGIDISTGERYFKTKDIVTVNIDSIFYYVGRKDSHIKIRGQKVNLQEIASCAEELVEIKNAHTICTKKNKIVLLYEGDINKNDIYSYLKKRLISAAMPSYLIKLDDFPVTNNGKKDLLRILEYAGSIDAQEPFEDGNNKKTTGCIAKKIFEKVLNLKNIDENTGFFDLGGDSLSIVDVMSQYAEHVGKDIDLGGFLKNPTIYTLNKMINNDSIADDSVLNNFKSKLDDIGSWAPIKNNISSDGNAIILTGCTGHIGFSILLTILNNTHFHVICIGRGDISRLTTLAKKIAPNILHILNRITWVTSDLNNLESTQNAIKSISTINNCHAVIHCAAHVNHVYDFNSLYISNVDATYNFLDFAYQNEVPKFIYISSTSSIYPDENTCTTASGYDLSKGASEKMVSEARKKKMDATIIKLPLVYNLSMLDKQRQSKDHFICKMLQCQYMKKAPNSEVNIVAMDSNDCASLIIELCKLPGMCEDCYIFTQDDGFAWSSCVKELIDEPLFIPYQEWRKTLLKSIDNMPLSPFVSLYQKDGVFEKGLFPITDGIDEKPTHLKKLLRDTDFKIKSSQEVLRNVLGKIRNVNTDQQITEVA